MMTLNNNFFLFARRQAAVLAVVLGSLSVASVSAVELVGKPVPLSSSSASLEVTQADAQDETKADGLQQAPVPAAAPVPPATNNPFVQHPFAMENHFDSGAEDRLVPVVAIIFCIGGPILIILVLIAMHYRAKERREKNINANIERLLAAGRDIPIELLRGDEPYVGAESVQTRDDIQLQKGIKNACLGVGLFICLTIIFGIEFGAIGFILMSIGVSQLWLWRLSGGKKNKIESQG